MTSYAATPPASATHTGPPMTIRTAAWLMYLGAGLSFLHALAGLVGIRDLRANVADENPDLTANQLNGIMAVSIVGFTLLGVLMAWLWVWMARSNRAGKSWARVAATVLFLFNTMSVGVGVFTPLAWMQKGVAGLIWLVGLAAFVLLYHHKSSEWYRSTKK